MAQLSLEIVAYDGLIFQEDIYEVVLPTAQGYIGVLPHHEALITLVVPGVLMIRRRMADQEDFEYLATSGGMAEISGKVVRLLADTVVHSDDVDELKVKESMVRAEQLKAQTADDVTFSDAVAQLELGLHSLRIAELKRRRRRSV